MNEHVMNEEIESSMKEMSPVTSSVYDHSEERWSLTLGHVIVAEGSGDSERQ